MARQKKPVHRVRMTEGKRNIIHQLLEGIIKKLAAYVILGILVYDEHPR